MLRQFLACAGKDLKNLFRNWTSIFTLVVGPLLLMGILILAFSGLGFSSIKIGVIDEGGKLGNLMQRLSYVGSFHEYELIEDCKEELKRQKSHLCIDVSSLGKDGEGGADVSSVDMYFDNSREIISYILISQFRRGIAAEKDIALKGKATGLIGEVGDARAFIDDSIEYIDELGYEIDSQSSELRDMRQTVGSTRQDLLARIDQVQILRDTFVGLKGDAESEVNNALFGAMGEIDNTINVLSQAAVVVEIGGGDATPIYQSINTLYSTRSEISSSLTIVGNAFFKVNQLVGEVDGIVNQMVQAANFLHQAELKLDQLLNSLAQRKTELQNFRRDLTHKRTELRAIEGTNVESLINPFNFNYIPLFKGSKKLREFGKRDLELTGAQKAQLVNLGSVQMFIPIVISLMICFIAVILSNIIVLDELHSPAYTRNLIVPVPWVVKTLAIFTTIVLVVSVQVGVILSIGQGIFLLEIFSKIGVISLVILLMIAIYAIIGMLFAYLIPTPTTSLIVSTFFLIINIFLSGLAFPLERMSPLMLGLSKAIPFTAGISILQQIIFYDVGFWGLTDKFVNLLLILGGSIVLLVVVYYLFKKKSMKG